MTTRPISDRSRARALRCCGWLAVVACLAAAPATAQQTEAQKSAVGVAPSTVTELAALTDEVLALPLSFLEQEVDAWIAMTLAQHT